MKYIITPALVFLLLIAICAGSATNVSYIKLHAKEKWAKQGFEVVDYEGYNWSFGGYGTPFGGGKVWHRLRKIPDNGITYSGFLIRWGEELHVYGPKACDAIQP